MDRNGYRSGNRPDEIRNRSDSGNRRELGVSE